MAAGEVGSITARVRKLLWARSGNQCAYPGCNELLTRDGANDLTLVGEECHIVARRDQAPAVRRPSQLSDLEKKTYDPLIKERHSYDNLVLLCPTHHSLVDDPGQGLSVAVLVGYKTSHERRIEQAQAAQTGAGVERFVPAPPQFVANAGEWEQGTMTALAIEDPQGLSWLHQQVGDPIDEAALTDLADRWTGQLSEGRSRVVQAVARLLEARGDFLRASQVWERHSGQAVDRRQRADRLARAAIDANVGQHLDTAERLANAAEAMDPQCPRLLLHRAVSRTDPQEVLHALQDVEVQDDDLLWAIIECQRALSLMQLGALDAAEGHVGSAERLAPEGWNVRSTRAMLQVQRGRRATTEGVPLDLPALQRARATAADLRTKMLGMRRWQESAGLLMLASDVEALLHNPTVGARLLRTAEPEEVEAGDNSIVLADAAMRTGDAQLTREFILNGPMNRDVERRILATAEIELPYRPTGPALLALRQLALSDSSEREQAGLDRLIACMYPILAPWDEEVAAAINQEREAEVNKLRVMAMMLANETSALRAAEAQVPNTPAGTKTRLLIAQSRRNREEVASAVQAVLQADTGASARLMAGRALLGIRHADAEHVLLGVARDRNAPAALRDEAYYLALGIQHQDGRDTAGNDLAAWQALLQEEPDIPPTRLNARKADPTQAHP